MRIGFEKLDTIWSKSNKLFHSANVRDVSPIFFCYKNKIDIVIVFLKKGSSSVDGREKQSIFTCKCRKNRKNKKRVVLHRRKNKRE